LSHPVRSSAVLQLSVVTLRLKGGKMSDTRFNTEDELQCAHACSVRVFPPTAFICGGVAEGVLYA